MERLNRTIKGIMFRYFVKKSTGRYCHCIKIQCICHKSVNMAPKDVNKDKETQAWINLYGRRLTHKRRKRGKFSQIKLCQIKHLEGTLHEEILINMD